MALLLKEFFIISLVASALTFPWHKQFENVHHQDDPMYSSQEDPVKEPKLNDELKHPFSTVAEDDLPEVYPIDAETREEHPAPDDPKKVHPLINAKREIKHTFSAAAEDDPPEVYPIDAETREEQPFLNDPKKVHRLINDKRAPRVKRGAVTNTDKLWTRTVEGGKAIVKIPYTESVSDDTERWLKTILHQLDQDTCIHFQDKTDADDHWVEFRTGSGGCSSYVGRKTSINPQYVNLGTNCHYRKTIAHEIMHLLGFYHEHTREDRDNYITVHSNNIISGFEDQFDIRQDQNNLGYGYDISSDMQYNEYAFSTDTANLKTMEANNGQPLGSNSHMDAMDVNKINDLYDCTDPPTFVDHTIVLKTEDSWLAGTDGDPFLKLIGSTGETPFQLVSSGGMLYANENEQGDEQTHKIPFPDVGTISSVQVALVSKGSTPSKKRKRFIDRIHGKWGHQKRLFSTDGWSLESVTVDGTEFTGTDIYVGDTVTL